MLSFRNGLLRSAAAVTLLVAAANSIGALELQGRGKKGKKAKDKKQVKAEAPAGKPNLGSANPATPQQPEKNPTIRSNRPNSSYGKHASPRQPEKAPATLMWRILRQKLQQLQRTARTLRKQPTAR